MKESMKHALMTITAELVVGIQIVNWIGAYFNIINNHKLISNIILISLVSITIFVFLLFTAWLIYEQGDYE